MSARWATLAIWALLMGSAVAWGLKLFVAAPVAPHDVQVAATTQAPRGDVTRVLGVDAVPVAEAASAPTPLADARFQLIGVVAPRNPQNVREGVAVIAIDGKPAKAFRVGARVEGDTVLQRVRARGAELGPAGGQAAMALQIAPPAPAATGQLPDARGATPGPGAGMTSPPPAPGMPNVVRRPGLSTPPPAGMPLPPQFNPATVTPGGASSVSVPAPSPSAARVVPNTAQPAVQTR